LNLRYPNLRVWRRLGSRFLYGFIRSFWMVILVFFKSDKNFKSMAHQQHLQILTFSSEIQKKRQTKILGNEYCFFEICVQKFVFIFDKKGYIIDQGHLPLTFLFTSKSMSSAVHKFSFFRLSLPLNILWIHKEQKLLVAENGSP
jgi:hypothetical protein